MSHPGHLILSPGTRIVTRNDANRIGGGQLIPSGFVAVITDSPADAQHTYKVRFNDAAEAMLRRNEFSILKEFKGEGIETTARGIDFEDWQPFIIYRCVVGSQASAAKSLTWTAAAFTCRPPNSTGPSTACVLSPMQERSVCGIFHPVAPDGYASLGNWAWDLTASDEALSKHFLAHINEE